VKLRKLLIHKGIPRVLCLVIVVIVVVVVVILEVIIAVKEVVRVTYGVVESTEAQKRRTWI